MPHTPGPWIVFRELGDASCGVSGRTMIVSDVTPSSIRPIASLSEINDHHNARLIAAAPELLSMLERLLGWADEFAMPQCGTDDAPWGEIELLLKRAKGTHVNS